MDMIPKSSKQRAREPQMSMNVRTLEVRNLLGSFPKPLPILGVAAARHIPEGQMQSPSQLYPRMCSPLRLPHLGRSIFFAFGHHATILLGYLLFRLLRHCGWQFQSTSPRYLSEAARRMDQDEQRTIINKFSPYLKQAESMDLPF
jgi:hypothetical protein